MAEETAIVPVEIVSDRQKLEIITKQATLLKDFVKQQGLSRRFGGTEEHIYHPAWVFIGSLNGYNTSLDRIEDIKDDEGRWFGYRAYIDLYQDGEWIAQACSECSRDQDQWVDKPRFQLSSMAQTRGSAKAFKMRLAHIVKLAGYSPTPAEDMDGNGVAPVKAAPKAPSPPKSAPKGDVVLGRKKIRKILVDDYKDVISEKDDLFIDWLYKLGLPTSIDKLDYDQARTVYDALQGKPNKLDQYIHTVIHQEKVMDLPPEDRGEADINV